MIRGWPEGSQRADFAPRLRTGYSIQGASLAHHRRDCYTRVSAQVARLSLAAANRAHPSALTASFGRPRWAGLGDHAAAVQTADELSRLGWEPATDAYAAARALATSAAAVEGDASLPEAERQKRVRSYADQAMDMQRQAVAKGYHDAARLKAARTLDPLRSREDFKQLLAELERKAPK